MTPAADADLPSGGSWAALVPEALGGSRVNPGRRGVLVIVLVAVVAAVVAGLAAWRARPAVVPVGPSVAVVPASATGGDVVVVAVAGKVRRPGLVRLPGGARVADAIDAAGGVLPGADPGLVNLARKVTDGEQILVGVGPPAAAASGQGPAGALISLNSATVGQLDGLPGVGAVLAQRIVDRRPFTSVDELREVDGIGEARFQKLRKLVTL